MDHPPTTIYPARRVITMNRGYPSADAVAVRGRRILGVGTTDELASWGAAEIDDRFRDQVLLPGFVEAHSHVMAGGIWTFPYVGFHDRRDPAGRLWPGCTTIDEVIERLVAVEAEMTEPTDQLLAWGLDPIYLTEERLVARHLDRVSEHRRIFIYHASGHLATVNSAMLRHAEITEHTPTPGVARDGDGQPNGELQEPAAMRLAGDALVTLGRAFGTTEAKWNYAYEARNAGHTTVADLGTANLANPAVVADWRSVTDDPAFPARVMTALSSAFGGPTDPHELVQLSRKLLAEQTDKLRHGVVKLILDGSIQGFSARVSWPHYFKPPEGHDGNGLWLIAPESMAEIVGIYHAAGLTVHCHCNGDEATEVFIDAVESALSRHPRWDHRHTVQHCQMATPAQYRRMAALGMHANIFSNHIYYWGDQHRDLTLGPERAALLDGCATALAAGVPFSIHSDAPVTPMGHLHTAWCAVNRLTASGEVLGPQERIGVGAALEACTLGAARQLKLDAEIGSLEAGKLADIAILDDDPLSVDPVALKDIGVWGTMLGGVLYEATRA